MTVNALRATAQSVLISVLSFPVLLGSGLWLWLGSAFADDAPPIAGGAHVLPSAPAAAGGGVADAVSQAAPGLSSMAVPFLLMFGVMYFLVLRPQKKRAQEQSEMLSALKHGDEVLTASGILGKVTGITDKVVTVEVADDVRVKMMKTQISQVLKDQKIKDLA